MDSGFETPRSDPQAELGWLLQSCLDGEPSAFEGLTVLFYARVYSLLHRLGVKGDVAQLDAQRAFSSALLAYRGGGDAAEFLTHLIQAVLRQVFENKGERINKDPEKQVLLATSLRDDFQFSPEQTAESSGMDVETVRRLLAEVPDAGDSLAREIDHPIQVENLTDEELKQVAGAIFERYMQQRNQQRQRVRLIEAGWVVLVIMLVAAGAWLMNRLNSGSVGRGEGTPAPQVGSPVYLGLLSGGIRDPADELFVALNPALDGASGSPKLSADGNTLVFVSAAANLVPHDTNRAADIFLYDRLAGKIERINAGQDGLQADQESLAPVISDDGRFTAFISWAGNLDPHDYGICPGTRDEDRSCADIFLYDRQEASLERILPFNGENGRGHTGVVYQDNAIFPALAISGDGRYLAFHAHVSNPGYSTDSGGLYIHDLKTRETWQVDQDAGGMPANGLSRSPAFSGDGRYLAFVFKGSGLGDSSSFTQVYLYDLQAGTLRRVTQGMEGGGANADVHAPVLSQDGRFLAFTTAADNLVPGDRNGQEDVFLYDRESASTQLLSLSPGLVQANRSSQEAALSAAGDILAYRSLASNLVPGDTNGTWDIFVFDRLNNTLELASRSNAGAAADGPSSQPSLSADGRYAAFVSAASNLVAGDRNGLPDVFLLDRATRNLTWVSASGSRLQVALPAVMRPPLDSATSRPIGTQGVATLTRTPLVTLVLSPTATATVEMPVSSTSTPTPPTSYPAPLPTTPPPTATSAYPAP